MGWPTRIHFPGAIFHVMSKGNNGQALFLEDGDREFFLGLLGSVKQQLPFHMFAYCLMSNHFHLLLGVNDAGLSQIQARVLSRYARHFNWKYDRKGHLFQSRFRAKLCNKDAYLLELVRYIHMNPVSANMVKEPENWEWSSHHEYMGNRNGGLVEPGYALSFFDTDINRARHSYLEFLSKSEPGKMPNETGIHLSRYSDFPAEIQRPPPRLEQVAQDVVHLTGIPVGEMQSGVRFPAAVEARRLFIKLAIQQGFTVTVLAMFLNCTTAAICKANRHS